MFVLHKRVVIHCYKTELQLQNLQSTQKQSLSTWNSWRLQRTIQKPQPASISPQLTAEVCHCDTQTKAHIKAVSAVLIPEHINCAVKQKHGPKSSSTSPLEMNGTTTRGREKWKNFVEEVLRQHVVIRRKSENLTGLELPSQHVEIKCQLDATEEFYCRSYCLLNMFRVPLCPSSGAREYYTSDCCLWYLVLWFSSCRYGAAACKPDT